MKRISDKKLEETAILYRVLAHAQRLRIIELLEINGEMSVNKIVKESKSSQSVISNHLSLMKRVGLISSDRRGNEVWYKILNNTCYKVLECIREKTSK